MQALVVEHEMHVASRLVEWLNEQGFCAYAVHSGRDAIDILRATRSDVVLLSLTLPDICGLEVLTEIKSENPAITVIAVRGRNDMEMSVAAFRRGADDVVSEPFPSRELLERIRARTAQCGEGRRFIVDRAGYEARYNGTAIRLDAQGIRCVVCAGEGERPHGII